MTLGGTLWPLDPDLSLHRLVDGLAIGNGLDWSLDGKTLFYIDSPNQAIDAFDVDPETGGVSGRRSVLRIPKHHGSPDGMCIDNEGCLWVALWDGHAVRRYSPAGEQLEVVELPVSRATCPAFAAPDGNDLYIPTASLGVSEPLAGGLFRLRPGAGVPHPPAS